MNFLVRLAGRKGLDRRSYALIGCVVLLAALLTGASWIAVGSSQERQRAAEWQIHTLQVLLETDDLKVATLSMVRGERGYLLTGDETFLQPYQRGLVDSREGLDRLTQLTLDNPQQQQRIGRLQTEIARLSSVPEEIVELKRSGDHAAALARVGSGAGRTATDEILEELRGIETIEQDLLAVQTEDARAKAVANERYQYALTLIGILLLGLSAWATILVRRALAAEAEARRMLQRTASSDEMTGLSNRRGFMDALHRSVARSSDGRKELAYAIFDIDRFKSINDTYGHAAGDAVIAEVARRAVATFRARDLVGRIGGEEFGVILPAANQAEAMEACARMRAAIEAEPIMIDGKSIGVTVSVGVSQLHREETVESLMARADHALYEAKNSGRNVVRLAA